jgi:hypothetical protein
MTDLIQSLAPTDLVVYRPDRFDGGGFSVGLTDLASEDVSLILQVYQGVRQLNDLWLYMKDAPNYDLLWDQVKQFGGRAFLTTAQAIGSATYSLSEPSQLARKVLHDVRGGALTSLVGYARLIERVPPERKLELLQLAVFLARDHAKMMRNALHDLDVPIRMADESAKLHPISDFVDKWDGLLMQIAQKEVLVEATSTFAGFVTNRCLETSAVDRILYNYINNAARFTTDGRVTLTIAPINEQLLRWVVVNAVSEDQQNWLRDNVGDDLGRLFLGGHTRGGHGIGLSNCADFTASSFGLENGAEAVQQRYVGAKIVDGRYYAWFHWPVYLPQGDEDVCEC